MKTKKLAAVFLLALVTLFLSLGCSACAGNESGKTESYRMIREACASKDGSGYTDMGNYLIWLDDFKTSDLASAVVYAQIVSDSTKGGFCTACVKKNKAGEVLVGRNNDMEISRHPAYIYTTSCGKYKTLSLRFLSPDLYTYEQFKTKGYQDKEFINLLGFTATDAINSEGLYVQMNGREKGDTFYNTGTNPGKTRARADMLPNLIAQNCATVKEAVEYVKNELDVYSTPVKDPENLTEFAYLIGDAAGEYGILEIAGNQIYYLPYQNGQGNYYLNPVCNAIDSKGSGYGRLASVIEGLDEVETQEEMFRHMEKAMWRDSVLYADCTYIDENGKIRFVNDQGEPIEDWRSDLYLSQVEEVWGKEAAPLLGKTARELMAPENAENIVKYCKDLYVKNGFKEKLLQYYAGNEDPLRDCGDIMTTGMRISVNCRKKNVIVQFFEKEDLTFEFDCTKLLD